MDEPKDNQVDYKVPPEQMYRQPGSFDHEKNLSWFTAHHILMYVLLGMLGLAIVAGAYYYQVSKLTTTDQQVTVHHKKVDPTSTWKTYTNTQYGFEFKYPRDWVKQEEGNSHVWVHPEEDFQSPVEGRFTAGVLFKIDSVTNYIKSADVYKKNVVTLDQLFDQYGKIEDESQLVLLNKTTFKDHPAYLISTGGMDSGPVLIIPNENNVYQIELPAMATADENFSLTDEENQILSTFKFTN